MHTPATEVARGRKKRIRQLLPNARQVWPTAVMIEVNGQTTSKTCERCGAAFSCSVAGACWCAQEPARLPMPKTGASVYDDCLCRTCLREVAAGMDIAPPLARAK